MFPSLLIASALCFGSVQLPKITPIEHASVLLTYRAGPVYSDPVDMKGEGLFKGLPQAKIIMITHAHSDHFQPSTIEQLTSAGTEVIAPADVAATLIGENATYKSITHVLANGQSVAIDGFTIHAVPM
eukprot:gene22620-28425_t